MAKIKEHTPGTVRYFTYWVIFPGDNEAWVDQTPFVHDLQFQLKKTAFNPSQCRDLLHKGETQWSDSNGVKHRVVIEETQRPKVWGKSLPAWKKKKRKTL